MGLSPAICAIERAQHGDGSAPAAQWVPKCSAPTLTSGVGGSASFFSSSSTWQDAAIRISQLHSPRHPPPRGAPKPQSPALPYLARVHVRARMCANVYPAPALSPAGYASSYREARLRQRPGVSLGTHEAIPEGRVTNRNCCAGSIK